MTQPNHSSRSPFARLTTFLAAPPRTLEITLGVLLLAVVVGIRLYLWHLLPAYLWSDDGNSYAAPAFRWLESGALIFDGRRGPTYTLLIAAALQIFGTVKGVIWLQHGLSALALLGSVAVARLIWGRSAVVPLFFCGLALALYGLPLHLGHLIRNETLLLVFSALAFGAWWRALETDRPRWLFVAALGAALVTMTKNVFVPFPFVLVAGVFCTGLPGIRPRLLRLGCVGAGLALPFLAGKIHDATAREVAAPEPQAGILFFGRTAQWTKLDGGIAPEFKALIREDIESYRRLPKLDNNVIINRTAVPHLSQALEAQGRSPTDLDRLCRQLAVEAVRAQPAAFARQIRNDLAHLHFRAGVKNEFPSESQIADARKSLRGLAGPRAAHPAMESTAMDAVLAARAHRDPFRFFHRCLTRAWLFQGYPVLFTTLALPLLFFTSRGKVRIFFGGIAAVWFFNMLLLSTVGRPLERYLMPLVPLMFWSLSGTLIVAWNAVLRRAGGLPTPP